MEHASHVMLSSLKLLNRILATGKVETPDSERAPHQRTSHAAIAHARHDATFGLSSDPLTHFVIVLSALVHDVDHSGTSNEQLVKMGSPLAARYHNRSVAERHSLHIAMSILMEDGFKDLQRCIFPTEEEYHRFQQLLVNGVLATDVVDNECRKSCSCRWDTAFRGEQTDSVDYPTMNRRATSVMEHIIQASDVAHTMQHWRIFCKWNERLYQEMYLAYRNGSSTFDPSGDWYQGQIRFFDSYVIPLAMRLKECGVFGVSSDEYLSYALANRREWEEKGKEVAEQMRLSVEDTLDGNYDNSLRNVKEPLSTSQLLKYASPDADS